MNEIQNADTQRILTRYFGIREKNPAPTLEAGIQPVAVVANLDPAQDVAGRRCAIGTLGWAQGVANQGSTMLHNPVGSNVIALVNKVVASTDTGSAMFAYLYLVLGTMGAVLGTPGEWTNTFLLNNVANGPPQPSCDIRSIIGLPIGRQLAQASVAINARPWTLELDPPVVLYPGWSLMRGEGIVNLWHQTTFFWEERDLTPFK